MNEMTFANDMAFANKDLKLRDLVRDDRVHRQIYTCLLYTSPSPRDLSTSRMPSSA